MSDSDVLLSAAFGLEGAAPDAGAESLTDAAQRVRDAIQRVPTLRPLFAGPGIVMELTRALRAPLSAILVTAWNAREEIRKFGDAARFSVNEVHEVWLREHTVRETFKPTVDVRFGGVPLPKLVFHATLSAQVHGAVLLIRDGRITHVKLGEVTTTGDLALGQAPISHELRAWSLPGLLKLGDGLKRAMAPNSRTTAG